MIDNLHSSVLFLLLTIITPLLSQAPCLHVQEKRSGVTRCLVDLSKLRSFHLYPRNAGHFINTLKASFPQHLYRADGHHFAHSPGWITEEHAILRL